MSTTDNLKTGRWFMEVGVGVLLIGGVVLLVLTLDGWSPAGGVGGLVAWGVGAGLAIRGGAHRVITALKTENERLRSAATHAEPGAAPDPARDIGSAGS